MPRICRPKELCHLLVKLWEKLKNKSKKSVEQIKLIKPPFELIKTPEIPIGDAWRGKTRIIPISESLGKIAADIICPYPPGIPLIIPGERIDKERLNWIETQSLYNKDLVNSYISVLNT